MSRLPVTDTCPECGIEFSAAGVRINGQGVPKKRCPNGHLTSVIALRAGREKKVMAPDMPVLIRLHQVGITGENEGLRLMVAALLGCYDRSISTLPAGSTSRAIVAGAFENTSKLARQMVDQV